MNKSDILIKLGQKYATGNNILEFVQKYQTIEKFIDKMALINERKRSSKEDYDKKVKTFDKEIETLRGTCTHEVTTFHPRATAESDPGYTTCDICGKEITT
jgi:hypothetical protein